jgi:hypothetical protein
MSVREGVVTQKQVNASTVNRIERRENFIPVSYR